MRIIGYEVHVNGQRAYGSSNNFKTEAEAQERIGQLLTTWGKDYCPEYTIVPLTTDRPSLLSKED